LKALRKWVTAWTSQVTQDIRAPVCTHPKPAGALEVKGLMEARIRFVRLSTRAPIASAFETGRLPPKVQR
jgi:hypothetical protein